MDGTPQSRSPPRNKLLRSLPPDVLRYLSCSMELAPLRPKRVLHFERLPIRQVHFVESGLVSVVAPADQASNVAEGWIIGCEGMVGTAVVLGAGSSPHRRTVLVEGSAWTMSSADLTRAVDELPELRRVLLRYVHSVLVQTAQLGACNARHSLQQRLARWILMAHDRLDSSRMPFTQETISKLLGVRRASVTEALSALEQTGAVAAGRGLIVVRDCARLEELGCHCYRVLGAEFHRQFGAEPAECVPSRSCTTDADDRDGCELPPAEAHALPLR